MNSRKWVYAIFIAIIVVCGILYAFFIREGDKETAEAIFFEGEAVVTENAPEVEAKAGLFVQLCGAIMQEGIYELDKDARVFEAVELAGGLKTDAAIEIVNQARLIKDGELIYFPTRKEVDEGSYTLEGVNNFININTASKEQLMTLPGVGEAKAMGIISYRDTHEGFKALEEIMKVDGIKEAMFSRIKDLITI